MDEKGDEPVQSQRLFEAGLYAGLKMAGVQNPKEFVNNSRLKQREKALSTIERKVLECVLPDVAREVGEVQIDLFNKGTKIEKNVTLGILHALKDSGLVRMDQKMFLRVELKDVGLLQTKQVPDPVGAEAEEPIDRMSRLAITARAMAEDLRRMASEIEEVAIAFEEKVASVQHGNAKLAQLRDLLKSFNS